MPAPLPSVSRVQETTTMPVQPTMTLTRILTPLSCLLRTPGLTLSQKTLWRPFKGPCATGTATGSWSFSRQSETAWKGGASKWREKRGKTTSQKTVSNASTRVCDCALVPAGLGLCVFPFLFPAQLVGPCFALQTWTCGRAGQFLLKDPKCLDCTKKGERHWAEVISCSSNLRSIASSPSLKHTQYQCGSGLIVSWILGSPRLKIKINLFLRPILVMVTIAVMKYCDQKQAGEKRVYLVALFITKGSQDKNSNRAGTWRQELMQRPWGVLLTGLLPMACSACLLFFFFLVLFFGAGDRTQSLELPKQALYHWAKSPTLSLPS